MILVEKMKRYSGQSLPFVDQKEQQKPDHLIFTMAENRVFGLFCQLFSSFTTDRSFTIDIEYYI